MSYIERAFARFGLNRNIYYKAAFIYFLVSSGVLSMLENMGIVTGNAFRFLSFAVSIISIPLLFGVIKLFMTDNVYEKPVDSTDMIFGYYQKNGMKSIGTTFIRNIVCSIPFIIFSIFAIQFMFRNDLNVEDIILIVTQLVSQEVTDINPIFIEIIGTLTPYFLIAIVASIALSMRYQLVQLLFVDEEYELRYFEAMKKSASLMKRNYWKLTKIYLSIFVIGLAFLILFSIFGLILGFFAAIFTLILGPFAGIGSYLLLILNLIITSYIFSIINFAFIEFYEDIIENQKQV